LLAQLGDDGRAGLPGGHSPHPHDEAASGYAGEPWLILAGIAELKGVRADGNDIVIGAMTTQHELYRLRVAGHQTSDPARNFGSDRRSAGSLLGTLGGNVANGDPGNDMPAVMMCLNASYQRHGQNGERRIAAASVLPGCLLHRA